MNDFEFVELTAREAAERAKSMGRDTFRTQYIRRYKIDDYTFISSNLEYEKAKADIFKSFPNASNLVVRIIKVTMEMYEAYMGGYKYSMVVTFELPVKDYLK